MKVELLNLESQKIKDLVLPDDFLNVVSKDTVKRSLEWQLSNRMSGNHKVKTSSEVSGSTRKPFRQKGTGSARQGNSRSPVLRGGGVSHGPVVRSHSISIHKKVKILALRSVIAGKFLDNKLRVFENYEFENCKSYNMYSFLKFYEMEKLCFVYEDIKQNMNLLLSARSVKNICTLNYKGLNVFDILRCDYLFFSLKSFQLSLKRFAIELSEV